jgi:magnesium-transporting ATPase (P-type)
VQVFYASALKLPVVEFLPLALTAILAAIPVALPATFTLATALGARVHSPDAGFFRRAFPPSTRRRRWMSSARTRPAR